MRVTFASLLAVVAAPLPKASAFTSTSSSNIIHGQTASSRRLRQINGGAGPSNSGLHMVAGAAPNRGGGMQMAVPNVMAKLPWNVKRDQERKERYLRREAAKLYREMGITEDATFEEINEATETMKRQYKDDLKKQIKIDVIKDKIMQLRLEQRMGGLVAGTGEARAADWIQRDAVAYNREMNLKRNWFNDPPEWVQKLQFVAVVKPNETWRTNCNLLYGILAALCLVAPGMKQALLVFPAMFTFAVINNRGRGDRGEDIRRGLAIYQRRMPAGPHTIITLLLTFVLWCMGSGAALLFTFFTGIDDKNKMFFSIFGLGAILFFYPSALYLQTYKPREKKDADAAKGQ